MNFNEMKDRKENFFQGNFPNEKEEYQLGTIETKEGGSGRFYLIDGEYYPSVTTVLGSIKNESLIAWQNRVGAAEAEVVKNRGASRGNILHDMADNYLNNKKVYPYKLDPISKNNFMNLKVKLDEIQHIYMQEQPLYSKKLKIAGRVDLIAHYKNSICLVDFKTSSKQKKPEHILNYHIQITAYAEMVKELFNIKISSGVILICVDGSDIVDEHIINTNEYVTQLEQIVGNYHKDRNYEFKN